jgi:hypothetical protein
MVSVPVRWSQIAYGRDRGLSVRRACTATALGDNAPEATPGETGVASACWDQALCYCRKS